MKYNIAVIPGDGIGPEVVSEAIKVLDAVAAKSGHQFEYKYLLAGGCGLGHVCDWTSHRWRNFCS